MDLLPPNLYGIDVAMNRLRPNARYQLEGTKFTIWEDSTGSEPPTWEEIQDQISKDMEENEAISRAFKEQNGPVADQVNQNSKPELAVKLPPAPVEMEDFSKN